MTRHKQGAFTWLYLIAPFVGRSIPLIGEVILAADVSQITYCSIRDYNAIARDTDKLW